MIGSRDYFEAGTGNFNVTLAHRQPGSSFKPFVYATAFKKGYTLDTVVFDLPTQFQTTCTPIVPTTPELLAAQNKANPDCYAPVNYDGKFRGPITLRSALAQSINIPAIKTLYLAGIKDSIATARDLGISSLSTANQYGLTLVLGGGEVSLLELTNAYGVFANNGMYNAPTAIERIEDASGTVLEQATPSNERVLDESITSLISDVLSDNVARAPSYGSDSPLSFNDRDVAAKTGTTNDYRDMWVIGYSPELTLGAWVGNNDNSSMEKKVAGFVVAPMWRKIFDQLDVNLPSTPFPQPDLSYMTDKTIKPVLRGIWQGGETYVIDKLSGKLASEFTPPDTQVEVPVTNVHEILNWINKDDPRGPAPVNPASDPQYIYWETPVKLWALSNGYLAGSSTKPTQIDDTHNPSFAPHVNILAPLENTTFKISDRIDVRWNATSSNFPIESAELYLNGTYLGSTKYPVTNFSFVPNPNTQVGNGELRVLIYDQKRNRGETTVYIKILP